MLSKKEKSTLYKALSQSEQKRFEDLEESLENEGISIIGIMGTKHQKKGKLLVKTFILPLDNDADLFLRVSNDKKIYDLDYDGSTVIVPHTNAEGVNFGNLGSKISKIAINEEIRLRQKNKKMKNATALIEDLEDIKETEIKDVLGDFEDLKKEKLILEDEIKSLQAKEKSLQDTLKTVKEGK